MTVRMLEMIRTAENLPSLPAVALEVLRLARSEAASLTQIAASIEKDPALTGRIMKVANSALFGMPRQICSVQQAILMLGLRTVKVMALSFSLLDAIRTTGPECFDYQVFWRSSLTSAVAARLLARQVGYAQPEEAFAAALLSDVGILAALQCDRHTYGRVLAERDSTGRPLHVLEEKHLGASHEIFSSHLLESWGLPEEMVTAVSRHHREPDQIIQFQAQPVSLLRTLAAAVLMGDLSCSADGSSRWTEVNRSISALLPLKEADLDGVLDALQEQVAEDARTWSIDIGDVRHCRSIQNEAAVQLAELTMTAELERAQLIASRQELESQNRRLAQQATTDGLTGINNRAAFEQHLDEVFQSAVPAGRAVGLLLLDLDRFKLLNDTFGHQVGDDALRLVAQRLSDLSSDRLFVARYGGEEFAIVLLDTNSGELTRLGEQVRIAIQQLRLPHHEGPIALSASIGAALVDDTCYRPSSVWLISLADQRLYQAKRSGRNRVICAAAHSSSRAAGAVPAGRVAVPVNS